MMVVALAVHTAATLGSLHEEAFREASKSEQATKEIN